MDDSLQDFQENKIPKKPQKPLAKTRKAPKKKTLKKENGQNDIRVVLKAKKNNLVNYTKEFNNVCIENGVDVDSEQLQLAIALSRSLKEAEEGTDQSKFERLTGNSSQNQSNQIRSTLREYGFCIPDMKKKDTVKRKRICRKNYKLLTTSVNEKKQTVADKVSGILLNTFAHGRASSSLVCTATAVTTHGYGNIEKSICLTAINDTSFDSCLKKDIFHQTGESYNVLKDDNNFYVGNLVEMAPNTVGCLLKDWSQIAGRPASPLIFADNYNFKEYIQNQEELDVILSGTMRVAQDLVAELKRKKFNITDKNIIEVSNIYDFNEDLVTIDVSKAENFTNNLPRDVLGCCSPDLFDDEPSISDRKSNNSFNKADVVDLIASPKIIHDNNCQSEKEALIDMCENMSINECNKIPLQNSELTVNSYVVDLTQESVSAHVIHSGDFYQKNETIDVTAVDLTQSSNSSVDSLPNINLNFTYKKSQTDLNTVPNTINGGKSKRLSLEINDINIEMVSHNQNCDHIDNVESNQFSLDIDIKNQIKFVNTETDSDEIALTQYSNSCEKVSNDYKYPGDICDSFDNSNDRNCVTEISDCVKEMEDKTLEYSNYGEIITKNLINNEEACFSRNISHDDIIASNSVKEVLDKIENSKDIANSKDDLENLRFDDEILSQCPQNVFAISDEELDYSMQYFCKKRKLTKSINQAFLTPKTDDFEVRRSSLFENIHERQSTSKYCTPKRSILLRRTKSFGLETSLPEVEIRGTIDKAKCVAEKSPSTPCTPVKILDGSTVVTPGQTEYVYKINNVTPILDYESLDTPRVHKELEKFGIKPFKRKRAVQLLEHIYYQTHPIMEYVDEDNENETKKHKTIDVDVENSIVTNVEPENHKQTERIVDDISQENTSIYEVDNTEPVIKTIVYDENDLVFQKREKAKVRSCRLPLHIAFHNYVHARSLLREAILRYEPISIDIVHKQLVKDGHRYDAKDLLKFMDKKCITVKTANAKNGGKRTKKAS